MAVIDFPFLNLYVVPPPVDTTDDFNRVDGVGLGANWIEIDTLGFSIVSNEAKQTPGGNDLASARYNAVFANDQHCEIILGTLITTATDTGAGPGVRFTVGGDLIFLQTNTIESRIYKRISGSYTQLGSDGPAGATGDTFRIEISGSTITAKKNGSNICGSPLALGGGPASGSPGMWTANGGGVRPSINSWLGG